MPSVRNCSGFAPPSSLEDYEDEIKGFFHLMNTYAGNGGFFQFFQGRGMEIKESGFDRLGLIRKMGGYAAHPFRRVCGVDLEA